MGFVRHKQKEPIVMKNFKGGKGEMLLYPILENNSEMYDKGRLFSHNVLEKGCEIGLHEHIGDAEIFYIIKGEGRFIDNGQEYHVGVGDCLYTGDGDTHYLVNESDEPLEFIALIVFK